MFGLLPTLALPANTYAPETAVTVYAAVVGAVSVGTVTVEGTATANL